MNFFKQKTVPYDPTFQFDSLHTICCLHEMEQSCKNHSWWITGTMNLTVFMHKEQFGTSLSVSVLKPPISFSPCVQEPFCLNPLHPVLQWDASSATIRKWANPSVWHFRQKERINSALYITSKTTVYTYPCSFWQASTACWVTNQHLDTGQWDNTRPAGHGPMAVALQGLYSPRQGSGSAGNQMPA